MTICQPLEPTVFELTGRQISRRISYEAVFFRLAGAISDSDSGLGGVGVLLKFALKQLDWRAALLVGSISALPLALALGIGPFTWRFDRYVLFAALAGIGALVAALAFNRAIQKGGSPSPPSTSW